MITFTQFDDEYYIIEGDFLYGRIIPMGRNNFWILWEDGERIPEHGLDSAKRYAMQNYKEHEPI